MGRIINQEEHLNTPLEELIDLPVLNSEKDKQDRDRALGIHKRK